MQFHWCIHSLGLLSAVLNPNERYTSFIFFPALISGRNLIYLHLHEPFPVSVCGTHCQGPTNTTLLVWRIQWAQPLHLPVAGQSSTLISMGLIRLQKIILVLCWVSSRRPAVVLEGLEAELCVHGQHFRVCVSADAPQSTLGITESLGEPHLQKWSRNRARAGVSQCFAAVCIVGPWDFEDLNFSEEKKSLEKSPPQVGSCKWAIQIFPFFMLSPERIKTINKINRTGTLAVALQKGLV